jgi:hypothetical protein
LSTVSQSLERLFRTLNSHSSIISTAYFERTIRKDGQNQRVLSQLEQQKILVRYSEDSYRLTAHLSKFLDHALNSERIRRLDTDLASWLETLEQLISLYQDAWHEQRLEDCDNYHAEIERLIFDLADTLEENTRYLAMQMNSRFATVRTLNEKSSQNKFYLARVEKLVNAINTSAFDSLREKIEDQPELQQLLEQQLLNQLPLYRQRLQDILNTLRSFLFEFREINKRVQLVRDFAFFLQKNPDYQLQNYSESDTIPAHWNQIQPLALATYADISDRQQEYELKTIVQKLKTDSQTIKQTKPRTINSVSQQTAQQKLELPLHRKYTQAYFAKVQSETVAVSALAFQQECGMKLESRLWLACVLHDYFRYQRKHGLQIEFIELSAASVFTGNKKVQDILIRTLAS